MSPVTASSASAVGCSSHSAERQPYPRIQLPCLGWARTRSSASASPLTPSSFTSRCDSDQVGKWTCESVKPGRTQRPPRSTTSGLGSAVSWVPTPPATCAPAMASARAVGSEGSIVRMTPFSRIMRGDCIHERRESARTRRRQRDRSGGRQGLLRRCAGTARISGRVRGARPARVPRGRARARLRDRPARTGRRSPRGLRLRRSRDRRRASTRPPSRPAAPTTALRASARSTTRTTTRRTCSTSTATTSKPSATTRRPRLRACPGSR